MAGLGNSVTVTVIYSRKIIEIMCPTIKRQDNIKNTWEANNKENAQLVIENKNNIFENGLLLCFQNSWALEFSIIGTNVAWTKTHATINREAVENAVTGTFLLLRPLIQDSYLLA